MRSSGYILIVLTLAGCTPVVQLRNAKTGETATCGGVLRMPGATIKDEHCLKIFHDNNFDPVP